MPGFEQRFGFGVKPEKPDDAEKRMEEARKAGMRRGGEDARESLKKAFEAVGLDKPEENPEEEERKEKVAA